MLSGFHVPLVGLKADRDRKATSVWILDGFQTESSLALHYALLSTWLVSKRKHPRLHMVLLCQDMGKSIRLTQTLMMHASYWPQGWYLEFGQHALISNLRMKSENKTSETEMFIHGAFKAERRASQIS